MMNNLLGIFFLTISIFYNAQKYAFTYEYNFRLDSLNLDKTETELMGLFIDKNESTYVSLKKIKRDSAINHKLQSNEGSFNMSVSLTDFPQPKISGIIKKRYKSDEVTSYVIIDGDRYKINDNYHLNWQVLEDTIEWDGKLCQKAITEFKGRKYMAWFTTDIPISDGPYKFKGLPGLIVKIRDTKNQHVWELKSIEKFKNLKFNFSKYISITDSKFKTILARYREDPMGKRREFMHKFNLSSATVTSPNGKSLSWIEFMKQKEKEIRAGFKNNNNEIELEQQILVD